MLTYQNFFEQELRGLEGEDATFCCLVIVCALSTDNFDQFMDRCKSFRELLEKHRVTGREYVPPVPMISTLLLMRIFDRATAIKNEYVESPSIYPDVP